MTAGMSDADYHDLLALNEHIRKVEAELTDLRLREANMKRELVALERARHVFITAASEATSKG